MRQKPAWYYSVQADMPFQILIPAYLPPEFDREKMEITVNQSGPGGEPMVQLAYPTAHGGCPVCAPVGAGQPGYGNPGRFPAG